VDKLAKDPAVGHGIGNFEFGHGI